jgi:4-amino-4-deoxy-L-arabinose transferase-like glycosyltransferase
MKKIIPKLVLLLAILLAIVTRFYKLGDAPKGLYLDEAAQGYNAYSILLTGKDEFGKSYPVTFRSFTDFKTPVYTYLIVPLIPVFGLTTFAIRFPSFFFSILTIPFLYLLLKRISPIKYAQTLSLLTTILLAISPWHIFFGRTAFECNVALFFLISGSYFFYLSLEKPKFLILSAFILAVSISAYHAQRILVPLLGIILFTRHRKILLSESQRKFLLISAITALLLITPTLLIINTPGVLARAAGLNIFSPDRLTSSGMIPGMSGLLDTIINNRLYLSLKEFASLYVAYFSPRNLFLLGDYDKRISYPELATFFVWQTPFYFWGLYKIIKDKNLKELRFFTLAFLFLSPLPAAVTRDPYSSIRSLPMVIPLLIIISLGMIEFWNILKKPILKIPAFVLITFLIIYSLGKLYSSVIILNEHYKAVEWNYGWQEVADVINNLDPQIPVIVDTARQGPYIELAFFLKYDPVKFQKDNFEVTPDEYYTKTQRRSTWNLGNTKVQQIDWGRDTADKNYLIGDNLAISDEQIKSHNLTLIKDILYPDKEVAFRIVKVNPD